MNPLKKIGATAAGVMFAVVSLFSVAFFVPPAPVRADPITLGALLGLVGSVFGVDFFSCSFNILFYCDASGNVVGNNYQVKPGDPCSSTANSCGMTNVGTLSYQCPDGSTLSSGSSLSDNGKSSTTCTDAAGNVTQATGVCSATPPPNSSCPVPTITPGDFTAQPSTVGINGKTLLSWNSSNTTTCSVRGDNGFTASGGASGSATTTPLTQTTTFTLTCVDGIGGPGTSASLRVIINPQYKEI